MKNFEITIGDSNNVAESMGITEERHKEFAKIAASSMAEYLKGDKSLTDCLKDVADHSETPNEVVFFTYAFTSSLEKATNNFKVQMMSQLLRQ